MKYYIRPRAENDPKKWQGPFDAAKLKELADRRLFSKELHEYSEDRLNWISARQIWPELFPKAARALSNSQAMAAASAPSDSGTIPLAKSSVEPVPGPSSKAAASAPSTVSTGASHTTTTTTPTVDWYCSTDGAQQGPFTFSQLQTFAADGRLQTTDLVWQPQFGEQWVEARTVPELFQFDQDSGSKSGRSRGQTPPLAILSFVFALLGITCLTGIGSIAAIIFGHVALSQFGKSGVSQNGKWMAVTGLILGYVTVALSILGTIIYLAMT